MNRLLATAACLCLAACALEPLPNARKAQDSRTGTHIPGRSADRVDAYSAEATAEEIRRNPPMNHPNNTGAVPVAR